MQLLKSAAALLPSRVATRTAPVCPPGKLSEVRAVLTLAFTGQVLAFDIKILKFKTSKFRIVTLINFFILRL